MIEAKLTFLQNNEIEYFMYVKRFDLVARSDLKIRLKRSCNVLQIKVLSDYLISNYNLTMYSCFIKNQKIIKKQIINLEINTLIRDLSQRANSKFYGYFILNLENGCDEIRLYSPLYKKKIKSIFGNTFIKKLFRVKPETEFLTLKQKYNIRYREFNVY